MASTARVREEIADIVSRPHNVRFSEIKRIMDHLGASGRPAKHGHLFCLNGRRLMINKHSDGRGTVPQYSVDEFRECMIEVGLY
jgi:hypothetical protein